MQLGKSVRLLLSLIPIFIKSCPIFSGDLKKGPPLIIYKTSPFYGEL